jgi:hypothetical protein
VQEVDLEDRPAAVRAWLRAAAPTHEFRGGAVVATGAPVPVILVTPWVGRETGRRRASPLAPSVPWPLPPTLRTR